MVDNIQTAVYGRQQAIETELNDQRAKLQEIETVVVKSVTTANKTVESELGRFEKIISAFEKYIDTQIGDMKSQNQAYFEEQKSIRGDSVKELLRKQDELHSSMQQLSQNINQVEEDSKDRASLIREENRVLESALTASY